MKRQRANHNRHARHEAKAKELYHYHVVECEGDSESDDDGSAEDYRSASGSDAVSCTDICCAGIVEYGS